MNKNGAFQVLERMDEDSDGIVNVNHVVRVIELIGRDHVKLSGKQIDQIVDMLQKEEMLEVESNIEKVLDKTPPDNADEKKESSVAASNSMATITREDKEDIAKDLTEQEPEKHIKEMFEEREEEAKEKPKSAALKADDNSSPNGKNGPMNLK